MVTAQVRAWGAPRPASPAPGSGTNGPTCGRTGLGSERRGLRAETPWAAAPHEKAPPGSTGGPSPWLSPAASRKVCAGSSMATGVSFAGVGGWGAGAARLRVGSGARGRPARRRSVAERAPERLERGAWVAARGPAPPHPQAEAEGLGCRGHQAVEEEPGAAPWARRCARPPPWFGPNLLKFSSAANLPNSRVHVEPGSHPSLSNTGDLARYAELRWS